MLKLIYITTRGVKMIKETENSKNKNEPKHHNIKKNIGRIIALIIVISMLLASSATLIFYIMLYLQK